MEMKYSSLSLKFSSGGFCLWAREKKLWKSWRRLQKWMAKRFIKKRNTSLKFVKGSWCHLWLSPIPCREAKTWAGKHVRKRTFIENNPNLYSKDPTELLGPLPYKRNEDYHHSHHHSLDAHKVCFKTYNGHLNFQTHFSLEFDCTVRNITNLDFSIYVSFCVSHLERNIHLRGTALCAPSLSEKVLICYYTGHIRCQLHWSSLQTFSQLWVLSGWAGGQNSHF